MTPEPTEPRDIYTWPCFVFITIPTWIVLLATAGLLLWDAVCRR